ncbi:MAG: hypothetical protein HUJ84_04525, partial [Veillonella sp.]|nr:hypothetical protein [Veillonella sp.]
MKKKRYMALSAAVIACLLGSGLAMKPLAEHYAAPLVQEQLNKSINGHVAYDSLSIAWDGTIDISNVSIVDAEGHAVGQADQVAVGLSLLEAPKLLTGGSAAQLISDVTVSDGNIHLWQDADQEWNVSHLIISDDSQDQVTFKGDVHFKNMDVSARPYGQEAYHVEAVTGGVSLSDMPRISGSASGLLDGQEVSLTGSIDTDNISDFSAYIKADHLDAKYANSFLAGHKDISLQGGYAKNIRLNVVGDGSGSMDLTGHAAIRDVAGSYGFNGQVFDFANAEANLAFTDNKILIQRGSADVNGQHGQVSGFVALGQDAADLSLDIVATDVDASALLPEPIEGTWAATIHVGGDTLAPTVSGKILGQNIAYQGYAVDSLKGDIDYRDNRLYLSDVQVAKGNSSLAGQLTYHTDSQDFDLIANPNQVQIGDFKDLLGYDVDGYVSG